MHPSLAFHLAPARAIDVTFSSSTSAPLPAISPFTLGLPLWHVLTLLSHPALRAAFPRAAQTDLTFHTEDPINQPILLQLNLATAHPALAASTVELAFEGRSQRLQLITLHLPPVLQVGGDREQGGSSNGTSPIELLYNSRVIHALPHNILTRGSLHQHLGPTYAGKLRVPSDGLFESISQVPSARRSKGKVAGEFLLSYPGMAFGFDIPADAASGEASARVRGFTDVSNAQSPTSIYIFRGSDPLALEMVSRPIVPPAVEEKDAAAREAWLDSQVEAGGAWTGHQGAKHDIRLDADTDSDALGTGDVTCIHADVRPGVGVTLHMQSSFISSQQARHTSSVRPQDQPQAVELLLGVSTPQDAIAELGTPQKIHWKDDDRLQIHRAASPRGGPVLPSSQGGTPTLVNLGSPSSLDAPSPLADSNDAPPVNVQGAMFYNYFDLGVDLLFSAPPDASAAHEDVYEEQRLLKVVLHSNVPGSALFQRYNRCRWSVAIDQTTEKTSVDAKAAKSKAQKKTLTATTVANTASKSASAKKASPAQSPAPTPPPAAAATSEDSAATPSVPFYRDFAALHALLSRKTPSPPPAITTSRTGRQTTINVSSEALLHLDRASSPQGSLRGLLSPDPVGGGGRGTSARSSSADTTAGVDTNHDHAQGPVRGLDVRTTLHGFDGLVVEEDRAGSVVGIMIV